MDRNSPLYTGALREALAAGERRSIPSVLEESSGAGIAEVSYAFEASGTLQAASPV